MNKHALYSTVAIMIALFPMGGMAQGTDAVSAEGTVEKSAVLQTEPVKTSLTAIVGTALVLDGSRSIDDGVITTFSWKQVSGPTTKLAAGARISVTPGTAGTYVFDLVVTDSTGLSSVAQTTTVIVTSPPAEAITTPPTQGALYETASEPVLAAPAVPTSGPEVDLLAATDDPSATPLAVEELGEMADSAASVTGGVFSDASSAATSTAAVIVILLGIWEWLKRIRECRTHSCARCGAQKHTSVATCGTCDGTGKIEKEVEISVECAHCKGSGVDPCHHCAGTGKMSVPNPPQSKEELEGLPPCDFCGGSGKKTVGAGSNAGNLECCFCKGKCEQAVTVKKEFTCPDCKGVGKK